MGFRRLFCRFLAPRAIVGLVWAWLKIVTVGTTSSYCPILTPPSTTTVIGPPVTVTVTTDPITTTSSKTQSASSSTVTSHSQSSLTASTSTSTSASSISTDVPDFLTTTYLTSEGTSLLTITALISNPSAHTNNDPAANSFFSNRTAVIGVFASVGVVVFAAIVAIIAWAARRRTIKRWQREKAEKESFDRRNFLQDEMHDELSPSEKSWWASGSGTTIPDGTGMPMRIVPPVPPLPTELSPTATTFTGSNASKSLVTSAETGGTILHPYGSPSYSMLPDVSSLTHSRSITSITSTREAAARSPPPSTPLPPLPYSSRGQDAAHLPMILEGTPSSTSTDGWTSHIQSIPPPSNPTPPLPLSRSNTLSQFTSSPKAPSHPYTSPPMNRKSELYAEDVLLDLGDHGGIGRSLSGNRSAHPPPPTKIHPPSENMQEGNRKRPDFGSRGQTSTGHTGSSGSHAAFREASGSGISDGGWYEDSPSEMAKAANGAAASGESVLGGTEARKNGFDYPKTRDTDVVSANGLSIDIAERRKVPHDPRFSGLFGAWADSTDEQYQATLQKDSRVSVDFGTEEGSPYAPRILRVTNE